MQHIEQPKPTAKDTLSDAEWLDKAVELLLQLMGENSFLGIPMGFHKGS